MNNYYVTSQLVAQHQTALAAETAHRAQLRDARAARKSHAAAKRPALGRRLFVFLPAHATA